jgi:hypothetical protein
MLYCLHHNTPNLYGKRSHPLLWASLRAALMKMTVSGISISLNCFESFITYKQFKNAPVGRIIKSGGPQVGYPWQTQISLE